MDNDRDRPVPVISPDVVKWLEEVFPNEVPDAETPEYEKCARAGEQRVMKKLRAELYRQQNGDDEDNQ